MGLRVKKLAFMAFCAALYAVVSFAFFRLIGVTDTPRMLVVAAVLGVIGGIVGFLITVFDPPY